MDNICVNIRLLSVDKLSALCGSTGQYELLLVSRLKEKASSVVQLEDILMNDGDDRIQSSAIAGSGKSTAFMEKASHEWEKVNLPCGRCPFWQNIALFKGNLTNRSWWKAQDLMEIFGLAWYNLTREEESEVVRYIKSHSQQVLLVANALDEAMVDKDSLLNPEHRGFPRSPLPPEVRDCRLHRRHNRAVHPSAFGADSGEDIRAADAASRSCRRERAYAHPSPLHTDVPSIPTGHGVAKQTDRCYIVILSWPCITSHTGEQRIKLKKTS